MVNDINIAPHAYDVNVRVKHCTNYKETSHILCDCEALADTLCHYLGRYILKPGD
jgi:hypothetical protein